MLAKLVNIPRITGVYGSCNEHVVLSRFFRWCFCLTTHMSPNDSKCNCSIMIPENMRCFIKMSKPLRLKCESAFPFEKTVWFRSCDQPSGGGQQIIWRHSNLFLSEMVVTEKEIDIGNHPSNILGDNELYISILKYHQYMRYFEMPIYMYILNI